MQIDLITVGHRLPSWINEGYAEYQQRFSGEYQLKLIEIPPEKRTKNADLNRIKEREGEKILAAILPKTDKIIALEVQGKTWSTEQLAQQLENWHAENQRIALLVGGPEGLSEACRKKANVQWSLSPLTLPHPFIRIIVAEQLYRAMSILKNHPYHRA